MSAIENFRAALAKAGLSFTGEIVADGRLHRFKAVGDKARNSWYVLHSGEPVAGEFGCWKRGIKETWWERNDQLSQTEWNKIRLRWQGAERERKQMEIERQDKARKTAARILERSKSVVAHPYLAAKGVHALGETREYLGRVALPLRDLNGELHSIQFIGADGEKRFLYGGRVKGCFFTVAEKTDGPLVICEGYATGASIHEATGYTVICAIDCGNMDATANAARELWPRREFIIAADNDQFTKGNPGLTKATEAARTVRARLVVPRFEDITTKPTDFNDLHQLEGLEIVKTQIENAVIPAATITPSQWFAEKFPALPDEYGGAILEETDKEGIVRARDIGEDFFAAALGSKGSPDAPTVFLPTEEKFYSYVPGDGIFIQQRDQVLHAQLSQLLLKCARECRDGCETKALEFRFRDAARACT